ncbi:MAG: Hsp70 family protein [Caulobacter sp.]|nr:Hsp70 family protein [Caulobacter sp.]
MIVGIDLGTTNSAVGVWRNGKAELIPNRLGQTLTPSAVGLDESGALLVGMAARERMSTHPGRTAVTFKRYMGSTRATPLGDRTYLPEELSGLLLSSLKADAEAFLGEPVTEAVITVPAYFNDRQRKATRRAGELAGLKVQRLLNEPTAAALAYGIHELGDESRFLVFDLGGGTFDVSILEIFEGVIEVRASAGDNRLGGEDFNDLLVAEMFTRFGKDWGEAAKTDAGLRQRLRASAERARRALTDNATATLSVIWKDQAYEMEITGEVFEARAAALLARLREPVLRSLRDSDIRAEALSEIVMVGGATRMPVVRRAVTRMFGRFPSTAVHPDEAVALGAAIQAGLKARDIDLKEIVLTDVCPYSLGVESTEMGPNGQARGSVFSPVIERNTVVPASRMQSFFPVHNGQRKVTFNIYQGESRNVSDNIRLGQVEIPVPPGKASEVEIQCRFTYDINGLIEVNLNVPASGESRELLIVDDEGPKGQDLAQQRARLALLKQHPRENEANRAALSRANRCYEDYLGDKRDYVAGLMSRFEAVLETQDPLAADHARAELTSALDALEGESYL